MAFIDWLLGFGIKLVAAVVLTFIISFLLWLSIKILAKNYAIDTKGITRKLFEVSIPAGFLALIMSYFNTYLTLIIIAIAVLIGIKYEFGDKWNKEYWGNSLLLWFIWLAMFIIVGFVIAVILRFSLPIF